MKNLKLILGLVVVMMTTIGVKGQHTVSLTLEDFDVVSVHQYWDDGSLYTPSNSGDNIYGVIATYDKTYIHVYNNVYTLKTIITIKSKNGGFGPDPEINHTFVPLFMTDGYNFINTNVDINQVTGEVFVELTLIGMGSEFLVEMQQLDLVYESESVANIFEHEQTNTTVTSYNKELTIKSSEYQNVDVQIYNMGGQMVNTLTNIELGYSDTKISMSHLVDGVYILYLRDRITNIIWNYKIPLLHQ